MADVQTVSIAIASASVVVGVVYYALQLRHQNKMRHLDLFMRLYSIWSTDDFNRAHRRVGVIKVKDYDSFVKKYGPIASEDTEISQMWMDIDRIGWFFNEMGFLESKRIVDIELIDELLGYWVIKYWENIKPLVDGWRKQHNIPESYHWFEYLYGEMKKREARGVKNG